MRIEFVWSDDWVILWRPPFSMQTNHTRPETNIAPENWWLETTFLLGSLIFRGHISFRKLITFAYLLHVPTSWNFSGEIKFPKSAAPTFQTTLAFQDFQKQHSHSFKAYWRPSPKKLFNTHHPSSWNCQVTWGDALDIATWVIWTHVLNNTLARPTGSPTPTVQPRNLASFIQIQSTRFSIIILALNITICFGRPTFDNKNTSKFFGCFFWTPASAFSKQTSPPRTKTDISMCFSFSNPKPCHGIFTYINGCILWQM